MKNYKTIAIRSALIVFGIWSLTFLLFNETEIFRGTFGDMFGAVNALFSGLAFAGIILTIYMQREELVLQRQELKETREVFEKQSNIMDDQQNDNTFFNLLANHRQMIESLRTSRTRIIGKSMHKSMGTVQDPVSGYEVIDGLASDWINYFLKYSEMYNSKEISDFDKKSLNPIELMKFRTDLITLFHEILHIYDFINKRFFEHSQKQFYLDTLWTNLSYSEKFIFEAYLLNFPSYQKSRNHKIETYSEYEFIDFNTLSIPEIEVKTISNRLPIISVNHNCRIEFVAFFAYSGDYDKNTASVVGVSQIYVDEPYLKLQIPINERITSVNSRINTIPYADSSLLTTYRYGIYCVFLHKNEKFRMCFDIQLTSEEQPHIEGQETKYKPVFNGNGIQTLSDDWREQICSELLKYEH